LPLEVHEQGQQAAGRFIRAPGSPSSEHGQKPDVVYAMVADHPSQEPDGRGIVYRLVLHVSPSLARFTAT